jgi:hypothetical protein
MAAGSNSALSMDRGRLFFVCVDVNVWTVRIQEQHCNLEDYGGCIDYERRAGSYIAM